MRLPPRSRLVIRTLTVLALMVAPAQAEAPADPGIDLKELEGSAAPPAQAAAPQAPIGSAAPVAPVVPVAPVAPVAPAITPVAPLVVVPLPDPMPLQWVPNGAPRHSELLDSYPLGASFSVAGIANQGDAYMAIVEYKGASYIVQPGTMVPDQDDPAFQVRAITAQRVEAFDPVMRRIVRRSLPPGGFR